MKGKTRKLGLVRRRNLAGLLFVLPWILGFVCFYGYQLMMTIWYSFNRIVFPAEGGYQVLFAGLDNFRYAFTEHATFTRTLVESLANMLVDVPLIIFFSLFMAVLVNREFRGRTLFRAILFLPVIMTTPVIVKMLNTSLTDLGNGMGASGAAASVTGATMGLNTSYLSSFFEAIPALREVADYIIGAIGRVYEIVRNSGVQILIFLAALQAISPAMYEVAKMEGATAYETFWKVTFPLVSPMILTNTVYTIVSLYSQSEIVSLAQTVAFGGSLNFGLSAVFSLVGVASVALIMLAVCWLISKKVFYQW